MADIGMDTEQGIECYHPEINYIRNMFRSMDRNPEQQLAAMGLNVEVDPGTGKVRVGSTRRAAGGGDGGGPSPGAGDSRGAAGSVPGGLLLGPEGARTPAGRAAVAALMAGLDVSREAGNGEDDDDVFEAPPNWKVADLS